MSVKRIREAPRITRPFSDESWARLDKLGEQVDADLEAGDVRLTMGGEPTFVSVDDLESPEWNIAAVGPTKRGFADELIRKLRTRFAPGGLLHYGQGKWYPGESLPRWAFGLYWRKDGVPIWKNSDLIAKIEAPRKSGIEDAERFAEGARGTARHRFRIHHAGLRGPRPLAAEGSGPAAECRSRRFQAVRSGRALADGAGVRSGAQRPQGLRAADPALECGGGQARAGRASAGNCGAAICSSRPAIPRWGCGCRSPRCRIFPPDEYPYIVEQDPLEPRDALPVYDGAAQSAGAAPHQEVQEQQLKGGGVRTAMSIEMRDGVLCVFMPPVERLEDYLELVAAVEATAEEMQMQVHVEGYPPPFDPRVEVIKVTPDPGVIEVNIHPATSWREAVEITFGLYEDARKFGSAPTSS